LGRFARVGQKTQLGRRWAKRGTRPVAVLDQRTASTYIFSAICPLHGKAAGLILPECNTEAMNLHLAEIAAAVAPGAHAVLILDQAGWHVSAKLIVPPTAANASRFGDITLVPLPPKCPELNPIENVWQYMRANWLSDRIFDAYDDIVDHCSDAWNKLAARPWTIMSIGMRDWANAY
jgi:transposase